MMLLATAILSFAVLSSVSAFGAQQPLAPGIIPTNSPGLHWGVGGAFSSRLGFYLITYGGNPFGCGATILAINGSVAEPNITLVPPPPVGGTTFCEVAYNPTRDTFLLVWVQAKTAGGRGAFLMANYVDRFGRSLVMNASQEVLNEVASVGISYDADEDVFMVYGHHGNAWTSFAIVAGQAPANASDSIIIHRQRYLVPPDKGMSTDLVFRGRKDKKWIGFYTVSHANGHGGGDKGDIWARAVQAAGANVTSGGKLPMGSPTGVIVQPHRQQCPRAAYVPDRDEVFLAWEDWSLDGEGQKGNVRASWVDAKNLSRATSEFWVAAGATWFTTGAVAYQPPTKTVWSCVFGGSSSYCHPFNATAGGEGIGIGDATHRSSKTDKVLVCEGSCSVDRAIVGQSFERVGGNASTMVHQMLFLYRDGYMSIGAGLLEVP